MPWDENTAANYERWEQSSTGSFALKREKQLVLSLVSSWPRRKKSLLEIGCGTGYFLQVLWEAGFDVTGIDSSAAMLKRARKRMGSKADLHLGKAEYLPFADGEFDYAVLLTVLEFSPYPEAILQEARRVCKKGVLIGYLNRFSLYYISHGRRWLNPRPGKLAQATWLSSYSLKKMIRRHMHPEAIKTRSVLPGPKCSWRNFFPCKQINGGIYPPVCGAYALMRIDLKRGKLKTPLLAWRSLPKSI